MDEIAVADGYGNMSVEEIEVAGLCRVALNFTQTGSFVKIGVAPDVYTRHVARHECKTGAVDAGVCFAAPAILHVQVF